MKYALSCDLADQCTMLTSIEIQCSDKYFTNPNVWKGKTGQTNKQASKLL